MAIAVAPETPEMKKSRKENDKLSKRAFKISIAAVLLSFIAILFTAASLYYQIRIVEPGNSILLNQCVDLLGEVANNTDHS